MRTFCSAQNFFSIFYTLSSTFPKKTLTNQLKTLWYSDSLPSCTKKLQLKFLKISSLLAAIIYLVLSTCYIKFLLLCDHFLPLQNTHNNVSRWWYTQCTHVVSYLFPPNTNSFFIFSSSSCVLKLLAMEKGKWEIE